MSVVGRRGRRRRGARVVDDGRRRGDVGRRLRTPGRRHARPGPHVLLRRAHRRRRRLMAMMSTAGLRLVRHLPAVRLHQICAPTLSADGRRRVVASAVCCMNEVNNARRARLVLEWVIVLGGYTISVSRYVKSQLGQLSLASLWGHLVEYQLRLGLERGEI